MALPFETTLYDTLYNSISTELAMKYPQHNGEEILAWHKRMLFEFVNYLNAKYEPDIVTPKVRANRRNNRRKRKQRLARLKPTNELVFNGNVERALDIVSQDPNFAIYLLAWWLPLLLGPDDHIKLCFQIDCSDTPASTVALRTLELEICASCFQLLRINNVIIQDMTSVEFKVLNADCFSHAIMRHILASANTDLTYNLKNVKLAAQVHLGDNIIANSFRTAGVLFDLKGILQPLFIMGLSLKSNMISEELVVEKTAEERQHTKRHRFNSRKYMVDPDEKLSTAELAAGVLQTLAISAFRTFYDYDRDTIDQALFDYLFLKKHSLTF